MKKTGKKLVSLLLAVVMLLSTLTVGLVAFAADEETPTITMNDFRTFVTAEYARIDEYTEDDVVALKAKFQTMDADSKVKYTRTAGYAASCNQYFELIKLFAAPDEYDYADEVANFVQTSTDRPMNSDVAWTEGGIQSAIDGLWGMVTDPDQLGSILGMVGLDLSNGLEPVLVGALLNADTIEMLFDLFATLSHDHTSLGLEGMLASYDLGKMLGLLLGSLEKCYATPTANGQDFSAAYAKISAAAADKNYAVIDEETGEKENKFDKMAQVDLTNEDLGIVDQASFVEALIATLRPLAWNLSGLNVMLGMGGIKLDVMDGVGLDGEKFDGIYTALIPLLEELGVRGLPTPEEYQAEFNRIGVTYDGSKVDGEVLTNTGVATKDDAGRLQQDYVLRPVIEGIFNQILAPIEADPINGLVDLLPRLANALESGLITDTVNHIISGTGLGEMLFPEAVDGKYIEINGEMINDMLPDEVDLSALLGVDVTLNIPYIDFAAFADCANVEVIESSYSDQTYRLVRTGATDPCFTMVFGLLYDVIADEALIPVLKDALKGMLGKNYDMMLDAATDGKLTIAKLENWVAMGKEDAYGDFLDTFGEPTGAVIEKPVTPSEPEVNPPVDKPVNPNDKTPTKNPNIPNTGVEMEVITSGVAYVVAMGLVGLAVSMLLGKKKVEE